MKQRENEMWCEARNVAWRVQALSYGAGKLRCTRALKPWRQLEEKSKAWGEKPLTAIEGIYATSGEKSLCIRLMAGIAEHETDEAACRYISRK